MKLFSPVVVRENPINRMEPLEARLLCKAPWGEVPLQVGLVDAIARFPRVNGAGTAIAVIDTGIDYTLPQLGGGFGPGRKVVAGWNFVNNNADPIDNDGHGTGIASILAADRYYYQGKRHIGIAWGATLVALKVDDGRSDPPPARISAAMQWVLDNRQRYNIVAVNISEGNRTFPTRRSRITYQTLIQKLNASGVFVAASSGNDGQVNGLDYPAADPFAVAVGSVNVRDRVSNFSDAGRGLDLLAPGEGVPVLYLDGNLDPIVTPATGTSFSAPFAAGTAALMRQMNSRLTVNQILTKIIQTGTRVADWRTGAIFSRVNIGAALRSV